MYRRRRGGGRSCRGRRRRGRRRPHVQEHLGDVQAGSIAGIESSRGTGGSSSCGIQPSSSERVASESGGVSATGAGVSDMEPVVLESESLNRLPSSSRARACLRSTRAGVSPSAEDPCSAVMVSPRASASDEGESGAPAGGSPSGATCKVICLSPCACTACNETHEDLVHGEVYLPPTAV